ncbi:polyamine ABC transporter substrate-binding protein [Ferrimonas futtsuensis]|uniref:polyamine ABC transporter substrate-binding protein n=1 Tax=Ferrimonas futtsuensis TaxID=364764 RepID=UPI000408B1E4|nr:spermidine/putrescine ABC transporter substrate-binding protein [Ferrimonas futtsuensis]
MHRLSLSLGAALFLAPSLVISDEVRVLTWEAYLSKEVIAAFAKQTGHSIHQVFISSDTERNAILATDGGLLFDLVMTDSNATRVYAQDGLIQPLSDKVPNGEHIDRRWQQACGDYGLAYSWGTLGIAYRSSLVHDIISWKQLFSPSRPLRGRVVMMTDIHDFTAVALIAAGFDPNSEERSELQAAYALMQEQQQYVLAYDYGLSYALSRRQDSQMAMTLAYSADVEEIIEATGQQDWVYRIPNEGTMLWVDCWTAPAGHPIKPATLAFLNFINQPEIAALNAETTWMPTPIASAKALTTLKHRQDRELYPTEQITNRSEVFRSLSKDAIDLRAKMVATIKD